MHFSPLSCVPVCVLVVCAVCTYCLNRNASLFRLVPHPMTKSVSTSIIWFSFGSSANANAELGPLALFKDFLFVIWIFLSFFSFQPRCWMLRTDNGRGREREQICAFCILFSFFILDMSQTYQRAHCPDIRHRSRTSQVICYNKTTQARVIFVQLFSLIIVITEQHSSNCFLLLCATYVLMSTTIRSVDDNNCKTQGKRESEKNQIKGRVGRRIHAPAARR